MIVYFGVFGLLYTLLVTLVGFSARHGAGAGLFPLVQDRDKTITEILSRMGGALAVPLALSILFASVTTANSIILTLSSMALRDVFRERTRVWGGKLFVALLTAAVFLFSVTRPAYVVELAVSSSSILLCFVPLLFGLFHWKRGGRVTGVVTLLAGAAAALLLRAFKVPVSAGYTLLASFAVFFIAGLLERRPPQRA
jgi:SSS family solute:Na+ symporter